MPNGDDHVTWDIFREHERIANDGLNRLGILENKVSENKEMMTEIKSDVKGIKQVVWVAAGAVSLAMFLLELWAKNHP